MPDSQLRYPPRNTQTRTRSGSEAIRRRVAQLMENSNINLVSVGEGSMVRSREKSRRRNSPSRWNLGDRSEERSHQLGLRNKSLPLDPSASRTQNRKDSPESGMARITASPSEPTSSAISTTISHKDEGAHPSRHTLIHVNHFGNRQSRENQAEHGSTGKEIDALQKALWECKLAALQQVQKFEAMQAELTATLSVVHAQEQEILTLKDIGRKKDELLSTIESSINCQICMDIPHEPYTLSPCGHVLCLQCLQEWFRRGPSDDTDAELEDMIMTSDVLLRPKSCPSCRAVIKHRPAPAYMIKAVASALSKSRSIIAGNEVAPNQDVPCFSGHDPWKGIFPSDPDESEDDRDESSDNEYEDDNLVDLSHQSEDDDNLEITFRAPRYRLPYRIMDSSDSDIDDSSGPDNDDEDLFHSSSDEEIRNPPHRYTIPPWVPPIMDMVPAQLRSTALDEEHLELLRRGCTIEMIDTYDIIYSHQAGIIVYLESLDFLDGREQDGGRSSRESRENKNRVFLGWNIFLEEGDPNGMLYLTNVLADIKLTPARWRLLARPGRTDTHDVRRLFQVEDSSDYDTTDSESFLDAEE